MSQDDGPENEPDFEDPSYADLRGLLAGAREKSGVPADVAARLEATLSGLVAERADGTDDPADGSTAEGAAEVVPLRRRPRTPRLLGAAAAVLLLAGVGVGVNQVTRHDNASTASADAAGGSSVSKAAPEAAAPTATRRSPLGEVSGTLASRNALLKLSMFTAAGFHRQVQSYVAVANQAFAYSSANGGSAGATKDSSGAGSLDVPADGGDVASTPVPPASAGGTSTGSDSGGGGAAAGSADGVPAPADGLSDLDPLRATPTCPGPKPTDGATVLLITFDGKPATLVLHPVVRGTQFVVAWSCDGSTLLAATTVRP